MRLPQCVFVLAVCGCVPTRGAEAPPRVVPVAETRPAILAPKAPAKKAPPRGTPARKAISPEMAAKISAVAMQVAPPPRAAAENTNAGASNSGGDSGAVQLDPFYVEEERFPEFKERQLLTPKGKLDLAYKRHPGLKLGSMPLFNDGIAREIIEDELAKERRSEMKELSELMQIGKDWQSRQAESERKINEVRARSDAAWHESKGPFRERK